MKTLVIAEKPSVGRDIARVLRCGEKGDGYLHGGEYIVSWAIGHLATLQEPEDYDDAYKKWRMEHLPILPEEMRCKPVYKTRSQLATLKKLMNDRSVSLIICATDSGREGELIFRYIYQLAKCQKPFKRLWISSMTDAAIQDGFARLRDGHEYDALYRSAKCRAEADWLVGMNATRAYTVQYGTLLSVGRVQTPTLAVLTERQKAIDAFVPADYWEVKATFTTPDGRGYTGLRFTSVHDAEEKTKLENKNESEPGPETKRESVPEGKSETESKPESKYNTKINDRVAAEAIADAVRGNPGTVMHIQTDEKRQPPPQLFDLTELQRECNRVYGYSAQKTLSLAQSLYEKHKLITYPRTDSRYLSKDMIPKLTAAVRALHAEPPYAEAAAYVLSLAKDSRLPVNGRIVNDAKVTDHHAIIPTGSKPRSLSKDEAAVYDRIALKLLAAFHPAYVYHVTGVTTEAAGERFITWGRTVAEAGWTALYNKPHDKKEGGEDTEALPPLTEGEAVQTTHAEVLQKKTQPPKAYTEATLLSAMEHAGRFVEDEALKEKLKDSGLGTPATRAAIIERLIEVGYVERRKKSLIPTEKGMKLIGIVPEELRSPETTGKWERGLSRIARGESDETRFMDSIKRYVCYIVEAAASGDSAAKKALFPKTDGGPKGRRGRTSAARASTTDNGSKAKSRRANADGASAEERQSICACPVCDTGQVYENSKAYYCSRWRDGCGFTLWKSALSKDGKNADAETVRTVCDGMRQKS